MVTSWFITGGCGFIGTSLIKRILSENSDVQIRVIDNLSTGQREDLAEVCSFSEVAIHEIGNQHGVFFIEGDIKDSSICEQSSVGADCIVHLAANTGVGPSVEDPRADMEANVIGTFNMLEAARKNNINSFVFASSGAPAGLVEPPITEEVSPHPVSPYGSSKLAGEGYCSSYYHSFGVNTVCLRFGNVYGPRSKHKASVVAKFISQGLNGEECEIYGDGNQTRDFIYIGDLISAIIKASSFDGGGETFQISCGQEVTLNELVALLKLAYKSIVGEDLRIRFGEKRVGDVMRNFADVSKARDVLGWQAEMPIEQGIAETVRDLYGEFQSSK